MWYPTELSFGTLLLNIFINDIIKASSKFDLILYADDTTLVSTLEIFRTLSNVVELEYAINCESLRFHPGLLVICSF